MARLSSEKYLARREKIITEGMHLFMEKGFHGTGIKDITNACEIPKGSFFNYFSSKESFAEEVVQFGSQFMSGLYERILKDEKLAPLARIKAVYAFRIDILVHRFQYKKGCLLNAMSQEMAEHSEAIAEATATGLDMIYTQMEQTLQEAQLKETLDKNRNARNLAVFIENSYRGAMVVSKSFKNREALDVFMQLLESDLLT